MSQKEIYTFCYGDFESEFDIRDADVMERVDEAQTFLSGADKMIPKDGKNAEFIRAECRMLKQFFDIIFGDGAGVKICSSKDNVGICYEAYNEFVETVNEQSRDLQETTNSFSKYSNRAVRKSNSGNNNKR